MNNGSPVSAVFSGNRILSLILFWGNRVVVSVVEAKGSGMSVTDYAIERRQETAGRRVRYKWQHVPATKYLGQIS
jgi:hypothetical protein